MFLLLALESADLLMIFIPESFEVLIFGVVLILLTVGLRAGFKRAEKNAHREMVHRTK